MEEIRFFSLVIPAFKQEKTIVKDISNIRKVFKSLTYKYEIIVVVDGSIDNTKKKLEKYKKDNRLSDLKIYSYDKNEGKGYAVKYGISKTKGDVVGFIDAGMDISPSSIILLIDYLFLYDADIVIGSKLHPDSAVNYPFVRRVLSWGYRTMTHFLFGFSLSDTQVGLKLFKRKVAMDIFPRILVKRFAFDVEVLAVAYARGFKKIIEAPVRLDFNKASSITSSNFWIIVSKSVWDTLAVFYRLKILHYYDKIHK